MVLQPCSEHSGQQLPLRGHLRASSLLSTHVAEARKRGKKGGGRGPPDSLGSAWCGHCAQEQQSRKSRRTLSRCAAASGSLLETIDYSFYLALGEVSDEWLWEQRLRPKLDYLSPEQLEKVQEALHLAYDSHRGQVRKSGEPFITHPVEVTRILAELKVDHESLVAGLLHDTVEDTTAVSFEEIQMWFGRSVRQIVEGETKFSKVSLAACGDSSKAEIAARDLQQLFLAMTQEVRIVIVKLADRLHNMRTLGSMPPHKQTLIARETLLVFAPLARLLGLYSVKEELESLAFQYSDPAAHAACSRRLDALAKTQGPVVLQAKGKLLEALEASSLLKPFVHTFEVFTLQKSAYSVHRRLREGGRRLEEVVDVAQLRLVLHPHPRNDPGVPEYLWRQQLCYQVLGLVHSMWAPIPGQLKDYISLPKGNGYRALHTTVHPRGLEPLFPLEVQIRTAEMHRLAEYGVAAESWMVPSPAPAAQRRRVDTSKAAPPPEDSPAPKGMGSTDMGPALPPSKRSSGLVDLVKHVRKLQGIWAGEVPTLGGPQVNGTRVSMDMLSPTAAGEEQQRRAKAANGHAVPSALPSAPVGELYTIANQPVREADLGAFRMDPSSLTRRINWLHSIRTWQAEFLGTLSATEFVDCVCDDLLAPCVFVYTMSGQVMRLPKGATPVDFAYHLHTEVGNTMIGAKVNGAWVPPSYALQNADVVQIIKYPNVKSISVQRHRDWLQCAQTKSARHKLQKYLRDHASALPPPSGTEVAASPEGGQAQRAKRVQAKSSRQMVVSVVCGDRAGLLADTAKVIAQHGHNILSHSGSSEGTMRYELEGNKALAPALLAALAAVPSVSHVERVRGAASPPSTPTSSSEKEAAEGEPVPAEPLAQPSESPSEPEAPTRPVVTEHEAMPG